MQLGNKSIKSKEEVIHLLSSIVDPEIPVVTIEEMGMLRDVVLHDDVCEVIVTPTYSGYPVMGIIAADIKALLDEHDIKPNKVTLDYESAWTTDWMTEIAKTKMNAYGIAPPVSSSCGNIMQAETKVICPHCGSNNTTVISRFGATASKALHKCFDCLEPFEYFKMSLTKPYY